jgi:DNA repair protein RadC
MRKENCELLPWSDTKSFAVKVVRVAEATPSRKLDSPEAAAAYWRRVIAVKSWFDAEKEHMVVLILSTKFAVQGHSLVSIGSMNETIAHPREIFRAAVAGGAYAIIVIHNHPSGDPSPSNSDVSLTRHLEECGKLLQIRMLDHVIMGCGRKYFSFLEADKAVEQTKKKSRRKPKGGARAAAVARRYLSRSR